MKVCQSNNDEHYVFACLLLTKQLIVLRVKITTSFTVDPDMLPLIGKHWILPQMFLFPRQER